MYGTKARRMSDLRRHFYLLSIIFSLITHSLCFCRIHLYCPYPRGQLPVHGGSKYNNHRWWSLMNWDLHQLYMKPACAIFTTKIIIFHNEDDNITLILQQPVDDFLVSNKDSKECNWQIQWINSEAEGKKKIQWGYVEQTKY